jgi:hypothetical protein
MIRKVVIVALSLLAVTVIILGLLSIWTSIEIKRPEWRTNVKIEEGRLLIGQWYSVSSTDTPSTRMWIWGGMGFVCGLDAGDPLRTNLICIPLWLPLVCVLIYPSYAFIRGPYRGYHRRRKGLCLKCGYNLTGNVTGVCPECGEKT